MPAALTNSLISSSDRPSSSWARASGLFTSLISLTAANPTHDAERLLRRLRAAELHRVWPLADRRPDPSQRVAPQPWPPPAGLRGLPALRPSRTDEPPRPRRSNQRGRVARLVRRLGGGGRPHPRLHPVLACSHTAGAPVAARIDGVDRLVRPRRPRRARARRRHRSRR